MATREPDLVGAVIVRYRVVRRIGTGKTGHVYEAEHGELGTRVALKVLHPEHHGSEAAARFLREGKTLGLFRHRNIVDLLEVGRASDGSLFLATELVRGISLRELIADGLVEPRRALAIVRQVLEALGAAHAVGVIHRDVKPENIMLADGGSEDGSDLVKVLDFGVAKLVSDTAAVLGEATLTQTGMSVFGSPSYVAPEIALGRPVDARCDVYSAGAVLYELLTGRPPFVASDPSELVRMHVQAPVPTLQQAIPDHPFSPQLEYVVGEALAKSPDVRLGSAAEMIAAIDAAIHALDVPAMPADASGATRPAHAEPAHPQPGMPPDGGLQGVAPPAGSTGLPAMPSAGGLPEVAPPAGSPELPIMPPPTAGQPLPPQHALPSMPPVLRRAQPRWRHLFDAACANKKVVVAAGATLLAVVVLVVVLAGGDDAPESAAPPTDVVERATELVASGEPKEAVAVLEPELAAIAKPTAAHAPAFLALGHARFAAGQRASALGAYERALRLQPKLASDEKLRANAVKALEGKDDVAGAVALELLATGVQPPAYDEIVDYAASGKNRGVRRRAVAIAEREGLADRLDRVATWSIDLVQATSCDERRALIEKLRDAGDERAIPALERARKHKCVDKDAAAAIARIAAGGEGDDPGASAKATAR